MRSNLVLRAKAREGWPVGYVLGSQSVHLQLQLHLQLRKEREKRRARFPDITGWTNEWSPGCVNSPVARGSQEKGFTHPRPHSLTHPRTVPRKCENVHLHWRLVLLLALLLRCCRVWCRRGVEDDVVEPWERQHQCWCCCSPRFQHVTKQRWPTQERRTRRWCWLTYWIPMDSQEVNSIALPKILPSILRSFVILCPNCSTSSSAQSQKDFQKWSMELLIDNPTEILVLQKCNWTEKSSENPSQKDFRKCNWIDLHNVQMCNLWSIRTNIQ